MGSVIQNSWAALGLAMASIAILVSASMLTARDELPTSSIRGHFALGDHIFGFFPCGEDQPDFQKGRLGYEIHHVNPRDNDLIAMHRARSVGTLAAPTEGLHTALYIEVEGRFVEHEGGAWAPWAQSPLGLEVNRVLLLTPETPKSCTMTFVDWQGLADAG